MNGRFVAIALFAFALSVSGCLGKGGGSSGGSGNHPDSSPWNPAPEGGGTPTPGGVTEGDPFNPSPNTTTSPGSGGGTTPPSSGGGSTTPSGGGSGSHTENLTTSGGTGGEGGNIPTCCTPSSTEKSKIDEVFSQLNAHRAANGKNALTYDTKLEQAIEGHCHHMAVHSFFAHNAPESAVSSPWTRANKCGTSASGENIAKGYSTPTAVMNGWKNSPGHNANMLNGSFKRVGIGYYANYWGQLFGN